MFLKQIFKWNLNGSITLYMWQAESEKLKYLKMNYHSWNSQIRIYQYLELVVSNKVPHYLKYSC